MTRLRLLVAVQHAYDDVVLGLMALAPVPSLRREALQRRRLELSRSLALLRGGPMAAQVASFTLPDR